MWVHGFKPRLSPEFFRLLYAIVKIAFVTAKIIASLDFISAVHMIHFIYHFIIDSFLTGPLEPTNDQLPTSVASYLSWLERCTGIARSLF